MSQIGLKKAVVMVVLRSGDALLLMKRTKEPNLGKYVPVGGHVEPFETPRDAALREVQEETGCRLEKVDFCGVLVETSPADYNWIVFVYSAEVERFAPPECREGILEWVEWSRLAEIPTPPTDLHVYRLIMNGQAFVLNAEFDGALNLLRMEDGFTGQMLHKAQ
jgi:8-oxo-dGTP diphosphatase